MKLVTIDGFPGAGKTAVLQAVSEKQAVPVVSYAGFIADRKTKPLQAVVLIDEFPVEEVQNFVQEYAKWDVHFVIALSA